VVYQASSDPQEAADAAVVAPGGFPAEVECAVAVVRSVEGSQDAPRVMGVTAARPDGNLEALDWAVAGCTAAAELAPVGVVSRADVHSASAAPPDDCSAAADSAADDNLAQVDSAPVDC
jgi:hypothetical protein